MKACPFCAEEIQDAAIVCKHCGRDLVAQPEPPKRIPPRPLSARKKVLLILATVLLAAYIGWASPDGIEGFGTIALILIVVAVIVRYLRQIPENTKPPLS